jgi:sensor histidine kinase YesM
MDRAPFIFSNAPYYRWRRHLAFWGVWWFSQAILYSFAPPLHPSDYIQRLELSSIDAVIYLAPHMFVSYMLMYFVIPRYVVKGKYVQTALLMIVLFLGAAVISAFESIYIIDRVRTWIAGDKWLFSHYPTSPFAMSLMAGLRGGLTVAGLAAAIKLMKYYYVKHARNLELQKENIASQLQLLKAQVHPHFLFNTLNNVYAHAQVGSSTAAVLIAGLSDLLRYMLYECEGPLVPLEKELKMVQDYVLLERVRYGNKLDVNIQVAGDTKDAYIVPLLLLPFIENCFKHGTSQVLEQPWVTLQVVIEDDWMRMKLLNGKAPGISTATGGIGIANAVKRLEYMYPGKHQLVINNEEDVFIVNLRVQLERKPETGQVVNANVMAYELSE